MEGQRDNECLQSEQTVSDLGRVEHTPVRASNQVGQRILPPHNQSGEALWRHSRPLIHPRKGRKNGLLFPGSGR